MSFDGVKLHREITKWWAAWKANGSTASHVGGGWMNRWVESFRASAYGGGHVMGVLVPLLTAAALSGWLLAIWLIIERHLKGA